jgi:2-oxo-4-hydroxy-4-carboxy-5-ureidoimidazoline decarboxylase
MRPSIRDLNDMKKEQFVTALGWIFEHSPWVAERAWSKRPFASVESLHATMSAVVARAPAAQQLALIRAHPNLATRAKISPVSQQEQAGVGLDRLSEAEFGLFTDLNERYMSRFGFPFIKAVRGGSKETILAALAARVRNEQKDEFAMALDEIYRIARFRLSDAIEVATES